MNIDLGGRTALITGASKGLGLATALRFAASGAHVAILARGRDALEDARKAITARAGGRKVVAVTCDVASADSIEAAYREVRVAMGPIDILVNNVGGHALGRFTDVTDTMWEHDLAVKLMATVRFTRLCWPEMVARRWGRVVNTLNTLAKAPTAGSAPTSVTRAAQLALTKVLAHEGGPHNILVNALLVGVVHSEQIDNIQRNEGPGQAMEGYTRDRLARIPLGRFGEPGEFADAACFLASDAASYITGSSIGIDGGMCRVI
jgi:NAD(P)-dependent dehydrogenase (short-subunit alcohol dehydrogenase family)